MHAALEKSVYALLITTLINYKFVVISIKKNLSALLKNHTEIFATLRGWQRYGVAFACGIAATLAMAPYYILPLFVLGYYILAIMLTHYPKDNIAKNITKPKHPYRSAFLTGWAFGFGYFLSGVYWIAFAFLIRGPDFAWMVPIAIPAFALFLGLFMAVPALTLAYAIDYIKTRWGHNSWSVVLLFTVLFSFSEYLRSHILTGLPWNLSGQALLGISAGAQSASIYGVYGLNFILLFLSALPLIRPINTNPNQNTLYPFYKNGVLLSLAGFALLYSAGALRLTLFPTHYHDDVGVIIVQPNILQKDKIDPSKANDNFQSLIKTSLAGQENLIRKNQRTSPFKTIYMVWPENTVPFLGEQPDLLAYLETILDPKIVLLTGTLRVQKGSQKDDYYNTFAVIRQISGKRNVSHYYDKHHLVPFGEYLPLQNTLKAIGLSQIAGIEEGFKRGTGPTTISAGGTSFAPLICYETIFPNRLYPHNDRPQWLVTVTNDAWFGDNAGPKQHLDQARLRAIESGLPMARSANTGISALIDPYGRIVTKIPLYQQNTINTALPQSASGTLYDRFGDFIYFLMVIVSLIIICFQAKAFPRKTG